MNGFGNFTPRAQRVIQLARKEADSFNHPYVGTEHLLLALLREGEGVAARVLTNLSVDPDEVQRLVLKQLEAAIDEDEEAEDEDER